MIEELDSIVLTSDLPEYGLEAGDIGTVVMVHQQGSGFEVEFCTLEGETVAVATVHAKDVRPAVHGEIPHARRMAG